jgi:hypothetical protein
MAAKFEIYEDSGREVPLAATGRERANDRLKRRELRQPRQRGAGCRDCQRDGGSG